MSNQKHVEVSPNVEKSGTRTISSVRLCWQLKERKGPQVKSNASAKGQQQQDTNTQGYIIRLRVSLAHVAE